MKYITQKIVSVYTLYLSLNCQLHCKFNFGVLLHFLFREVHHTIVTFDYRYTRKCRLCPSFLILSSCFTVLPLRLSDIWASTHVAARDYFNFMFPFVIMFHLHLRISLSWIFTHIILMLAIISHFQLKLLSWMPLTFIYFV